MAHAATPFWHHFHPWTTKNMDLETVFHFAAPNHRKMRKCVQSRSRGAPQICSKIDENQHLSPVCPLGVPAEPRITKMVSRAPKKKPQGLQNNSFGKKQ